MPAQMATQNTVTSASTVELSQCTLSEPAVVWGCRCALGRAKTLLRGAEAPRMQHPSVQNSAASTFFGTSQKCSWKSLASLRDSPSVLPLQRLATAACSPAPERCVRLTWQMYFIGFCSAASFFSMPSITWLVQFGTCRHLGAHGKTRLVCVADHWVGAPCNWHVLEKPHAPAWLSVVQD